MEEPEKELSLEELAALEQEVKGVAMSVIRDENKTYGVEAEIFPVRNVGVKGDQRSYAYPAMIAIYDGDELIYDTDLLSLISTRITNEIDDVNRVATLIGGKIQKS